MIKSKSAGGLSLFRLCAVWLSLGAVLGARGATLRLTVNPYADIDWRRVDQHRANLHTHTVESGGEMFSGEVFKEYAALGYTILALTDHNHCTHWEKAGIDPVKQYGILPVMGQEYSKGHHVCGLFLDHKSAVSENGPLAEEIGGHGGVAVLNHPGRYWKPAEEGRLPTSTKDEYLALVLKHPAIAGIEVFNKNDRYPRDLLLWDALLGAAMPGRPVWGFANDDTHERSKIGYSWETFLMDGLNEPAFRSALARGRFYLSVKGKAEKAEAYPPIIQSVAHDPAARTLTIRAAADGAVLPEKSYRWISNGNVVCEGPVLDYGRTPGIVNYVRAELSGEGGTTYTNPFGFSRADP